MISRWILAGAALLAATPAFAGDVAVTIKGVEQAQGDLYVSLQTRDQFMKDEGTYGKIVRDPAPGDHTVVLKDVAPGNYSVAVWHDIDGDKQFDRDENGRPLDGWAMVNGTTLRAKPSFDKVRLAVPDSGAATSVAMIYNDK